MTVIDRPPRENSMRCTDHCPTRGSRRTWPAALLAAASVAVVAVVVRAFGSVTDPLSDANQAVDSAIGVVFGVAVLAVIVTAAVLTIRWLLGLRGRRAEAARVAEVRADLEAARARTPVSARRAREAPAATTRHELPEGASATASEFTARVDAVRLDRTPEHAHPGRRNA